ncbi:hypothetical protein HKX48_000903, partial [Thoreauomyces humboldtii]
MAAAGTPKSPRRRPKKSSSNSSTPLPSASLLNFWKKGQESPAGESSKTHSCEGLWEYRQRDLSAANPADPLAPMVVSAPGTPRLPAEQLSSPMDVTPSVAPAGGSKKKRKVAAVVPENPDMAEESASSPNGTPSTRTPVPRTGKRKPKTAESSTASMAVSTPTSAPATVPSPFPVSIRKGKVVFQEKPLNFEKHPSTVADLTQFFSFSAETKPNVLDAFPTRFHGLLAKLVEESSLDLENLAGRVRETLCPPDFLAEETEDDGETPELISEATIAAAIGELAERKNYGIQRGVSAPLSVAVWRWEIRDQSLFSVEIAAVIAQRREKRALAAKALAAIFDALSSVEQMLVFPLNSDGTASTSASPAAAAAAAAASTVESKEQKAREKAARQADRERKAAEKAAEKAEKEQKATERKQEKERKEKEKQDEREKRESERQAQKAEADLAKQKFAGFFFKGATAQPKKPVLPPAAAAEETRLFWEMFPPFQPRGNMTVAPHNIFARQLPLEWADTLFRSEEPPSLPVFERSILPPQAVAPSTAQEDDIKDLDPAVQRVLRSRWKLLRFREDYRPAYWGTWTKSSTVITGRRPFAKDATVLDYNYDSEAEWEDEGDGEDLMSEMGEDDDEMDAMDLDDEEVSFTRVAVVEGTNALMGDVLLQEKWLVPHGYLSEDEGLGDDAASELADADRIDSKQTSSSPIKRVKDMPKWGVLSALVPQISQLVYATSFEDTTSSLSQYRICSLMGDQTMTIDPLAAGPVDEDNQDGKKTPGNKKTVFPEDRLLELHAMIQRKFQGIGKLVEEIKIVFPEIPKNQIELKIREIAVKEKRPGDQRPHWYIKGQVISNPPTPVKPPAPSIIALLTSPRKSATNSPSRQNTTPSPPTIPSQKLLNLFDPPKSTPDIHASFLTARQTLLHSESLDNRDACLKLLQPKGWIEDRLDQLPEELKATLIDVAGNVGVQADLRSRCLRLLGDLAPAALDDERGRKAWAFVAGHPALAGCLERNLEVDRENGASINVVKNA